MFTVVRIHASPAVLNVLKAIQSSHLCRYFFQQLIIGVRYCHTRHVTHRDLKLENTLLDSSPPLLKICDFGYCKDMMRDTPPITAVGTPAYISPVSSSNNTKHTRLPCLDLCVKSWIDQIRLLVVFSGQMFVHELRTGEQCRRC